VAGRSDVMCLKLLIFKLLTSMRQLERRSNQLNYVPSGFSYG
jgi:hypothetical protein